MIKDCLLPLEQRFSELAERIAGFFDRVEPRQQAIRYAEALLARASRNNGWQIAREIGDPSPWRTQRLLNRAHWDVDGVRDAVRGYVVDHLGHPDAIVALGELATIKKGTASVGVGQQYSAVTGRLENCQLAIFAAYVSPYGQALIDRELYLPSGWAGDLGRCRRAGIPLGNGFAGKSDLGRGILDRVGAAGVPFSWVSGDIEFGRDPLFLAWLAERRLGYVMAIPASALVTNAFAGTVRAGAFGDRLPVNAKKLWLTGGPDGRQTGYAGIPIGIPLGSGDGEIRPAEGFDHRLLISRVMDGKPRETYYLVHAPEKTSLPALIRVARAGSGLDDCMRDARERAGLDQYEVRTWKAWYRHVTLAMLAIAPDRVDQARDPESQLCVEPA